MSSTFWARSAVPKSKATAATNLLANFISQLEHLPATAVTWRSGAPGPDMGTTPDSLLGPCHQEQVCKDLHWGQQGCPPTRLRVPDQTSSSGLGCSSLCTQPPASPAPWFQRRPLGR